VRKEARARSHQGEGGGEGGEAVARRSPLPNVIEVRPIGIKRNVLTSLTKRKKKGKGWGVTDAARRITWESRVEKEEKKVKGGGTVNLGHRNG